MLRVLIIAGLFVAVICRPSIVGRNVRDVEKILIRSLRAADSEGPTLSDACHDADGVPVSTGPFEKPGDCEHFYQCSNGYLYVRDCAPGTVFNPELNVCDHPWNVTGCGGENPGGSGSTDPPTTTPAHTERPFDDDCLDDDGNPISGDPYQKKGDCFNFYQCSNGYRYEMPCAPGTAFNPDIGVCDWPWNVDGCGKTTEPPTTTTTAPAPPPFNPDCVDDDGNPLSGEPFEKPGDCDNFYQCSNGYRYEFDCPAGLAFNPGNKVCDWPWNVTGCGRTPEPPTTTTTTTTLPPYDHRCVDADGNPISSEPFQNPDDCETFFQCSNGYLYTLNCPAGLVFNPGNKVCDWPWNVTGCGRTPEPPTTTTTTTTTPPFHEDCVDANGNPISGEPFEKEGDCSGFYQCSNGYRYEFDCPADLVFNPGNKVCDWSWNVTGCGRTPEPPTTTTTTQPPPPAFDDDCVDNAGAPISGDPFEKPGDCDHFYQCSNGYRYTMPCAPGTAFNPSIGVCDYPYNVPGCGGSTSEVPSCTGSNGEPLSTGPLEKPGSCGEFYQCGAGILYTMQCAPGTVFNPIKSVCDWPSNVPGC